MTIHPPLLEEKPRQASHLLAKLEANVASVFLGKPETIRMALVALLAEGHLLIEDVPGIGKTLLAKALARSLGCSFHRIQFTPDLLPSDVLGTSVFHQGTSTFVFQPGPLFAQVVLADEINRATPRTQKRLVGSDERSSGVAGWSNAPVGSAFFRVGYAESLRVRGHLSIAGEPARSLPHALRIGYPEREAEKRILTGHRSGEPVEHLQAVLSAEEVVSLQHQVRQVRFEETLADYLLDLIAATRYDPDIHLGGSTRAALALYRAAQGLALVEERDYVVPDDIKRLAVAVLAHRILPRTPHKTTPPTKSSKTSSARRRFRISQEYRIWDLCSPWSTGERVYVSRKRNRAPLWAAVKRGRYSVPWVGFCCLLIALSLLAIGVHRRINLLMLLGDVLVVIMLWNLLAAGRSLRRLQVRRRFDEWLFARHALRRGDTAEQSRPVSTSGAAHSTRRGRMWPTRSASRKAVAERLLHTPRRVRSIVYRLRAA